MSKINKRIEALEAELQKLKNEVKNDIKLEAGKWYWFGFEDECNKRYLILFDRVVEKGYFYKYMINILSEHYLNKRNDYISKSNTFLGEATHQEVEEALIKEAKKRGFKEGVSFKTVERKGISGSYNTKFKFDRMNVCIYENETVLLNNGNGCIFCNGVWTEIVKGEPIKIGGRYEVVFMGKKGTSDILYTKIDGHDFLKEFWQSAKVISEHSKAKIMIGCSKQFDVSLETINQILEKL